MSKTAAGGSSKNLRDSHSKRLGLKIHDGQPVDPGKIIIRQRGMKYAAGQGVRRSSDDTLFAITEGIVKYSSKMKTRFDGSRRRITVVSIVPVEA